MIHRPPRNPLRIVAVGPEGVQIVEPTRRPPRLAEVSLWAARLVLVLVVSVLEWCVDAWRVARRRG